MTSLFRNSRTILTKISSICRTSATTSTSNGGTAVRPSGASTNLSQTSRSADGTDIALRDAKQRATSSDPIKPKSAGESSSIPTAGTSLNSLGKIGFGIIFVISAYFIYNNYIKNPELAKSLNLSKEASKRDAQGQSADQNGSTGKKH